MEKVTLGNIAHWSRGYKLSKKYLNTHKNGNRVIFYTDIRYMNAIANKIFHWSLYDEGTIIPTNSIIIPMSEVPVNGENILTSINQSGVRAGSDIMIGTFNNKKVDANYISLYLTLHKNLILKYLQGTSIQHLHPTALNNILLRLPNIKTQHKIAKIFVLNTINLDDHKYLLKLSRKQKLGCLQRMFPRKGQKKPDWTFNKTNWHITKIKDLLNYTQPISYRIKGHNYTNIGTPVLTANKSFILGYTLESNICKKYPCIIYDDFTLENKFVSFPFMVKSSAIKILTASKKSDIYFDYALLNSLPIEVKNHKRHYISLIQNLSVVVPDLMTQRKIGKLFRLLDIKLSLVKHNIQLLHQRELGLMQNLIE